VLQLGVAAVLLCAVELVVLLDGPLSPSWLSVLIPVTAGAYVVAGVVAWLRRRSSDLGALLVSGGLVWLAAGFGNAGAPALVALGTVTATVPLAVIVHLLVAFPSGRLTTRPLRALVGAAYLTSLVLQMPLYLFSSAPPPYDALQIADRPDLLSAGLWIQRVAGILVMSTTAAVLVRRLRSAAPSQRRLLAPLYAYGVATVLFVPLSATVLAPRLGWSPITLYVTQLTVCGLVPVAFGWSLLRGGFARTAELEELGAWLGDQERGHPALQRALAEVLGDPSVDLVFWVPERGDYVDVHGRAAGTSVHGGGARCRRWSWPGRAWAPSPTTPRRSTTRTSSAGRVGWWRSRWTGSASRLSCWRTRRSSGSPGCASSRRVTGSGTGWSATSTTAHSSS
jgi:hypothetical protein